MKFKGKFERVLGLSISLAKASFKLRNEGTYLGVFWYLLNPVLLFILLLLVFSTRLGQNIPMYPAYLLLGIIIYNLFQQVTTSSIRTMGDNKYLIKSLKFPRESLVASNILRALFEHMFEIIILFAILLYLGASPSGLLFYIPILLIFAVFLYGISLILASLYIYFIDIENIWLFASKLIFFVTPIFYAFEGQTKLHILNLFNPLYYYMEAARDVVIYQKIPEPFIILGMLVFSLLFLTAGIIAFSKLKRKFAEYI
jgi:ABC-type polysaccharide/polyol phosphate export permease